MITVQFTSPNGKPVWINVEAVLRFAEAGADTPAQGGTMIWLLDGTQVVNEPPSVVLSKIAPP